MVDRAERLGSELRPEYVEKIHKIKKEKGVRFKSMQQLREYIEHA